MSNIPRAHLQRRPIDATSLAPKFLGAQSRSIPEYAGVGKALPATAGGNAAQTRLEDEGYWPRSALTTVALRLLMMPTRARCAQ